MRKTLASRLENLAARVRGLVDPRDLVPEITDSDNRMLAAVRPLTMTQVTSQWAFINALRSVAGQGVAGDIVECGVWRGGNLVLAAMVRKELRLDTTIWAYDTFAGMTAPTDFDTKTTRNLDVKGKFDKLQRDDHNDWCYASLDDVLANYEAATGTRAGLRTIVGPVQETLADPANLPKAVSVIRLDTDFFDSTLIELETFWPLLSSGGVMFIDDYGAWAGAKKAVDEYFAGRRVWLHRIDRDVRMIIKS